MDLTQQTIGKLRQMLDSKEISAPELTQSYLDRIAKYDDTIQSYITVTAERALADAAAAQKKLMREMQACFAAFHGNQGQYLHRWHQDHLCFKNAGRFHSAV